MLIHHPRNFALLAIPRTGAASLHAALAAALDADCGFDNGGPDLFHLFAADARRLLGRRRWPQLHSVAVVRNPYDRAVSLWHDHRASGRIPAEPFDAFLRRDLPRLAARDLRCLPQKRFVWGDGKVLVKRLYAYEDGVQAILYDICAGLGLPRLEAPHDRRSARRGWEEYYPRAELLELVAEIYAEDFDLLGYERLAAPPILATA